MSDDATPEQIKALRALARDFAKRSIVMDATARLVEQVILETHAQLAKPRYTEKQKEWLARYLATGLASGPSDRIYQVDMDKWIADVKAGFDVVDTIND